MLHLMVSATLRRHITLEVHEDPTDTTHVLTKNFSPKILKFQGLIHNFPVIVLIDSGSSHNILQLHIVIHLLIQPNPPFRVMVGNDDFITCQGISSLVKISLQTSLFTIPFYLLPIEGSEVVMGIEWLRTLDPFKLIYVKKTSSKC